MLRLGMVGLTYLTYLSFYLARKADAITKSSLQQDAKFSMNDLAMADTFYLITYTFALFGSGMLGARVPSNVMLTIGLCGIAGCSFLKSKTSSPGLYAFLQIVHAVFQSFGWPTCIKVLSVWVNRNRGTVMGVWTTCQSLGGVVGAFAGTHFLIRYDWKSAYTYHVPVLLLMAGVVFFFVRDEPPRDLAEFFEPEQSPAPAKADKHSEDEPQVGKDEKSGEAPPPSSDQAITLSQVITLPGVLAVGTSYFFLKFMRYALLFWLPYYYQNGLNYSLSVAGFVSTTFEMGGAVGTPLIGYVSDKYMNGKRDLAAGLFMAGAAVTLSLCILLSAWGPVVNGICMGLTGILVIGPDSVLSGTIAQDIGQRSGMGKAAVGSVAGLLNSMGSAGSIFQSIATAYISRVFGWSALFTLFAGCASISSSILIQLAWKSLPPGGSTMSRFKLLFNPTTKGSTHE